MMSVKLDRVMIAAEMAKRLLMVKDVAEMANVSRNSASKAVRGDLIGVKVARQVCDALGLAYDRAILRSDEGAADDDEQG